MQKVTNQSKMEQISTFLERIDEDHDGQLKVDDVLKVINTRYLHSYRIRFCRTNIKIIIKHMSHPPSPLIHLSNGFL